MRGKARRPTRPPPTVPPYEPILPFISCCLGRLRASPRLPTPPAANPSSLRAPSFQDGFCAKASRFTVGGHRDRVTRRSESLRGVRGRTRFAQSLSNGPAATTGARPIGCVCLCPRPTRGDLTRAHKRPRNGIGRFPSRGDLTRAHDTLGRVSTRPHSASPTASVPACGASSPGRVRCAGPEGAVSARAHAVELRRECPRARVRVWRLARFRSHQGPLQR